MRYAVLLLALTTPALFAEHLAPTPPLAISSTPVHQCDFLSNEERPPDKEGEFQDMRDLNNLMQFCSRLAQRELDQGREDLKSFFANPVKVKNALEGMLDEEMARAMARIKRTERETSKLGFSPKDWLDEVLILEKEEERLLNAFDVELGKEPFVRNRRDYFAKRQDELLRQIEALLTNKDITKESDPGYPDLLEKIEEISTERRQVIEDSFKFDRALRDSIFMEKEAKRFSKEYPEYKEFEGNHAKAISDLRKAYARTSKARLIQAGSLQNSFSESYERESLKKEGALLLDLVEKAPDIRLAIGIEDNAIRRVQFLRFPKKDKSVPLVLTYPFEENKDSKETAYARKMEELFGLGSPTPVRWMKCRGI